MRIERIREKLVKSGRAVFSINDIAKYGNISRSSARVYVNRMEKRNLIKRVARNKYTISNDPFIIASQLLENSYISFASALYIYGIIDQIPSKIYVVSPKRTKINLPWLKIVKFSSKNIFGFRKISKENSFIVVGELEKVIIDIAYKLKYAKLSYAFKGMKTCNRNKLVKYAKRMSLATQKRIGYMLDLLGVKTNLNKYVKGVHKLNPRIKKKGVFNSKWGLYINEVLKDD